MFNSPHVCVCPKPGPRFPTLYVLVFLFSELRWFCFIFLTTMNRLYLIVLKYKSSWDRPYNISFYCMIWRNLTLKTLYVFIYGITVLYLKSWRCQLWIWRSQMQFYWRRLFILWVHRHRLHMQELLKGSVSCYIICLYISVFNSALRKFS
jgi:hypothetical protein